MTPASITSPSAKHVSNRWTSAAGLLAAAVVLCACRTSTGVFANLAAAATDSEAACTAAEGAGVGGPIPPAALLMLVETTKLLSEGRLGTAQQRLQVRSGVHRGLHRALAMLPWPSHLPASLCK
ncbi:hypothetical protein ABPG75_001713 [Micractinium tetrahymenae]